MHSNLKSIQDKIALYEGLRPESFKRPIVKGRLSSGFQSYLLACMPKSGSTWFKSVFSCMPKCIAFRAVPAYGAREQEIDSATIDSGMQMLSGLNTISQHHVKYNINTRNCLFQFGMRPIVLFRNIRDNLVSLVDHWKREDCAPSFSAYVERSYFDADFHSSVAPSVSPLEYATTLHAPWIINFYLSWTKYAQNPAGGLPECISPVFVKYEEMISDPERLFSRVFSDIDLVITPGELNKALNDAGRVNTRKNKGVSGRGIEAFEKDPGALESLERILKLYKHEDLTGIGIS